jgi:hypothetical protein
MHEELLQKIQEHRLLTLQIGSLLSGLKHDDNFENETGVDSWYDYISQPEIGLSNAEANKLMLVDNIFKDVDVVQLVNIPFKNLLVIAKTDKPTEHLTDAEVLSHKDLKERLYEKKTEDTINRTYKYMVMKKCVETGNLSKVHDIESETIEETFNLNEDGIRD